MHQINGLIPKFNVINSNLKKEERSREQKSLRQISYVFKVDFLYVAWDIIFQSIFIFIPKMLLATHWAWGGQQFRNGGCPSFFSDKKQNLE